MMRKLLEAGMNVARLNFSHGDFSGHAQVIANLRAAAKAAGRRVAIMADLPGPKMRIGMLPPGGARKVFSGFDTALMRGLRPQD